MPQPASAQAKFAAAATELILVAVIGYFSVKWLLSHLDPTSKSKMAAKKQAEVLLKSIGVKDVELSDYEMTIATNLINPLTLPITWHDIGGLEETVYEIRENVVLPFRNRKIFANSSLLSPPRGVLLYGPPGCGKTMVAKATAKEAGCRFINLDVSSLTDKWYGESQKLAGAVFSLAYKLQPCIIFMDEIDSFLRSRASHDHEATAMMKAQFMSLWDGLLSNRKVEIVIMGATNRPQDVDKAILRRMPCRFHIGMPTEDQRLSILKIILKGEKMVSDVNLNELARNTEGYSGSDLRELCRAAALYCVRDSLAEQENENSMEDLRPISMDDFEKSINRLKLNSEHLATHGVFGNI